MRYQRAFPIFSIIFVLTYALCFHLADINALNKGTLFIYYPAHGEFHMSPLPGPVTQTGPPMLWYGWSVTSAIVAAIIAGLSTLVSTDAIARHWSKLVIAAPIVSFAALCWMERAWFLH